MIKRLRLQPEIMIHPYTNNKHIVNDNIIRNELSWLADWECELPIMRRRILMGRKKVVCLDLERKTHYELKCLFSFGCQEIEVQCRNRVF